MHTSTVEAQSQLRISGKNNFGISKKVSLFTEVKLQGKVFKAESGKVQGHSTQQDVGT